MQPEWNHDLLLGNWRRRKFTEYITWASLIKVSHDSYKNILSLQMTHPLQKKNKTRVTWVKLHCATDTQPWRFQVRFRSSANVTEGNSPLENKHHWLVSIGNKKITIRTHSFCSMWESFILDVHLQLRLSFTDLGVMYF